MKRSKQDGTSSEVEETSRRRNRRQALALGGAAAAAAVAALAMDGGKTAHAVTGDPLVLGQSNEADSGDRTTLSGNVPGNEPGGSGVLGISNLSPDTGHGLLVDARGGFGPEGPSVAIWGNALNADGTGPGAGHGVMGWTGSGFGVHGVAQEEAAAAGVGGSAPGDSPGVRAFSGTIPPSPDGGLALDVIGKARFSTAGSGVVAAGAAAAIVLNPAVTAESHVTVTFTGNPGRARLGWVQRFAGAGFILRLAGGLPPSNVPFTYLIVEPGA